MSRPQRCRRICRAPRFDSFSPYGSPGEREVKLILDEFEVIRLVDLEKKTHEQCAVLMDISRTTVTEIYESAREKIADCIVNGKTLVISGGHYRMCNGEARHCCGEDCDCRTERSALKNKNNKGVDKMKIAVTYDNGQIFQHFGRTEQFCIYDVQDGVVTEKTVVPTNGTGHGAVAGFLKERGVDSLICGGIGGGARAALAEAGIKLYPGVSGSADEAAALLAAGELKYDPNIECDHHEHEHGHGHGCHGHEGGHSCHGHEHHGRHGENGGCCH